MSTKSRSRRAEQVRQMQAAAARKERMRRLAIAGSAAAVVVIIIVVLVVLKVTGAGSPSNTPAATGGNASKVVSLVTSVPASTLNTIGAGAAAPPKKVSAPPLTAGGKPKVLYVGAEYCPYCAATRWGMVQALSRFGTWTGLSLMSSTTNDVYPNTPTLTFHGASYASKYVTFTGLEVEDRNHNPLETPSAADEKVFKTYASPPYVPSQGFGGPAFPFIDFGGSYLVNGSAYNPAILSGMSHVQVAQAMHDPSSDVAKAADGEANLYTAAICSLTKQQPATVCTAPGVKTAAAALAQSSG